MVMLKTKVKQEGVQLDPKEVNFAVDQELADIIQGAELDSDSEQHQTHLWNYWMPFAGVRYYSYEERRPQ